MILDITSLFSFKNEKYKRAFEEEENEILQRNIEENSDNIWVAVSSIASVLKPSTSLCFPGKSRISSKNSSSGSREWTHNEIIELIAIWKEEETLYNIRYPVCFIKQEINNDTKQYWFLSLINDQLRILSLLSLHYCR